MELAEISSVALLAAAVVVVLVVSVAAVVAVPVVAGGVAAGVHLGEVELAVLPAALVESLPYQNQRP